LKPPITAEPEIAQYTLKPEDELMILSCDGLYDVLDYPAIATFLDENIKKGVKVGNLASALVREGVAKGSTDDITVMLVDFTRKNL
jgi:serine/threonine protein phosphatase PrpC